MNKPDIKSVLKTAPEGSDLRNLIDKTAWLIGVNSGLSREEGFQDAAYNFLRILAEGARDRSDKRIDVNAPNEFSFQSGSKYRVTSETPCIKIGDYEARIAIGRTEEQFDKRANPEGVSLLLKKGEVYAPTPWYLAYCFNREVDIRKQKSFAA